MSAQKATGLDRANDQPCQDPNNHEPIICAAENLGKREATLIANFALRGHAVHRLADGGFLVCRHNLSRHCEDLAALVRFARLVGVY